MNTSIFQPDEIASDLKMRLFPDAPWLAILIIYEASDCGDEAMDLFRELSGKIAPEHPCNLHIWKLGDIEHPEVKEGVIESLQTAAMVIFAAQVDYQLPPETRTVLDAGLAGRPEKAGAMVALLGDSSGTDQTPSEIHSYLREAARKAGLKYYQRSFAIQPKRPAYTIRSIQERAETITATLRGIMRFAPPQTHGGINE